MLTARLTGTSGCVHTFVTTMEQTLHDHWTDRLGLAIRIIKRILENYIHSIYCICFTSTCEKPSSTSAPIHFTTFSRIINLNDILSQLSTNRTVCRRILVPSTMAVPVGYLRCVLISSRITVPPLYWPNDKRRSNHVLCGFVPLYSAVLIFENMRNSMNGHSHPSRTSAKNDSSLTFSGCL